MTEGEGVGKYKDQLYTREEAIADLMKSGFTEDEANNYLDAPGELSRAEIIFHSQRRITEEHRSRSKK